MAHAVLIAGSEDRFAQGLAPLRKLLKSRGHSVEYHREGYPVTLHKLKVLHSIERAVAQHDDLLLVFSGHGSPFGWENGVTYEELACLLFRVRGNLCVVNEACYGAVLLPLVQAVRSKDTTCFLTSWDGDGVAYPCVVNDCVTAWSQGKVIEDLITSNVVFTPDGDVEKPIQIRWGQLDHLFW